MAKKRTEKSVIPKWDNWHIRLSDPKEQIKIIDLFHKSGAKTKTDFVKTQLFREDFKVIVVDKAKNDYFIELSHLNAQVNKIGTLYNQVVKRLHTDHSVRVALFLIKDLEKYTKTLMAHLQRTIELTEEYRDKGI